MDNVTPIDSLDPARKELAYRRVATRAYELKQNATKTAQQILDEIRRRAACEAITASVPPVFKPVFSGPARYRGAHGGRGSAKSHSFARALLRRAKERKGYRVACVREIQKSLEQSVKKLLEDVIKAHSLESEFKILNTHIETPGSGMIIFQGMQNHTADSIKSLEGFDLAWVEEAQSLSERSLTLLRPTIRKTGSEIWFTWNPNHETDPIDKFLRANPPPDSLIVQANYKDNPHLSEVLQKEMEWDRARDIEKYNHIWLGGYQRKSEARVFKNWRVEPFEKPTATPFFLYGGDFGFSVDPTVLVRGYIVGRTLYIDNEAYQVGCEIDHTPTLFDKIENGSARRWIITADSARPETISYLKRHGYPRVVPAKKGPGSVEEGIEFLKSFDIIVHPRCTHVIDELTMYCYKTHPLTDEIMPVLDDKHNHTIDALRYMLETVRNPKPKAEVW